MNWLKWLSSGCLTMALDWTNSYSANLDDRYSIVIFSERVENNFCKHTVGLWRVDLQTLDVEK